MEKETPLPLSVETKTDVVTAHRAGNQKALRALAEKIYGPSGTGDVSRYLNAHDFDDRGCD
jgi:hypothetical protein